VIAMSKNKCRICNAIMNDNEELCPFCGTPSYQHKEEFGNTAPMSENETIRRPWQTNAYYSFGTPTQQPYEQKTYQVGNTGVTQTTYRTTGSTYRQKKTSPIAVIAIIIIILIMMMATALPIMFVAIKDVTIEQQNADIEAIVNQKVDTDKVKGIPLADTLYSKKVNGNNGLYFNDNYMVFEIRDIQYSEVLSTSYDVTYCVYLDLPQYDDEYRCDGYSAKFDTDNYELSAYACYDFQSRHEMIYVSEDDSISKLNNIKIENAVFEVYEIKRSYGYTIYELFSRPIDNGTSYLKIGISIPESSPLDYKDIIQYATIKTEKSSD
jgi:hypothetical protein